ncbi:dTMP kinase [Rhodobacteraceae bacterium RKSG542]|uniref:dTMP kinase n=1 Tax=Pseudovibrio flavus TaxID=2529854 RepID=UPI00352782EE|nr:dTMP kinase [Pseudovibrio flavus]
MRGKFITFEGGEGAGKSTQIRALLDFLKNSGISAIVTREPGGSKGAEVLREVLLSGAAQKYGPAVEAMLFAAARQDHVDSLIAPALAEGKWVLCDRFADSSRVYQGEAGVSKGLIDNLQDLAVNGHIPDLTLLIDVPPEIGLARVGSRSVFNGDEGPDRFEKDTLETHRKRRELFLEMAKNEPWRFKVIDGSQDQSGVTEQIFAAVREQFPEFEFSKQQELS